MMLKKITLFVACITLVLSIKAQETLVSFELIDSYDTEELQIVRENLDIPEFFIPIDYEVDVYKLIYNTPDPLGNMTIASGAVCIPKNMDCSLPLCSYQHGTVAGKMDVPSYKSGELDLGLMLACTGYILALPDYLGLGDGPGLHPYIHAKSEGTACLDMLRAVRELSLEIDLRLNDQLMLLGYSQGGHATMALHKEIEENASDEFKVDISIPMSGPFDVSGVQTDYITRDEPYPTPGYLPYIILAYQSVYGDLYENISEVLKPPYDKTIPPLFDGSYSMGYINSQCTAIPSQMLQDSTLENFKSDPNHRLRKALRDNDLYNWLPKAPIHMLYCEGDDQVNYLNSVVALDAFQANGITDVFAQNMGTNDHGGCVTPALFRCKNLMDEVKKLNLGIKLDADVSNEEGSILLNIEGGNPPFKFNWSNGDETKNLENLLSGSYSLTITDTYDCSEVFDFEIIGSTHTFSIIKQYELNIVPNPSNEIAYLDMPEENGVFDIEIYDIHGQIIYRSENENSKTQPPALKNSGIYFVKVIGSKTYLGKWILSK